MLPYTVERRPDTGVNNVMLGTWLFLASEVMLFGGLLSSYVLLRSGAADWPAGSTVSSVPLGALNTGLLVLSSAAIAAARRSAAGGSEGRARAWLAATAALGAVFLSIKAIEYGSKLGDGLYPATSTYFAVYYLLTVVHALHVAGGVGVNAWLSAAGVRSTAGSLPRFANRVAASALYWHFVDVVWIVLFVLLYLV